MSNKLENSWIRYLDTVIGLIVIFVAIVAALELAISFVYTLEVLLVGLFAMGIAWIAMGIYILHAYLFARLFMLITGFAAIAMSLIDLIFISLPPDYLVLYPSIAMLLVGSSRFILGLLVSEIPLWIRMLQILAGILSVNLAAFVFIIPGITFQGVITLLIITFLANGLVRLIVGGTDVKQKIVQSSEVVITSE